MTSISSTVMSAVSSLNKILDEEERLGKLDMSAKFTGQIKAGLLKSDGSATRFRVSIVRRLDGKDIDGRLFSAELDSYDGAINPAKTLESLPKYMRSRKAKLSADSRAYFGGGVRDMRSSIDLERLSNNITDLHASFKDGLHLALNKLNGPESGFCSTQFDSARYWVDRSYFYKKFKESFLPVLADPKKSYEGRYRLKNNLTMPKYFSALDNLSTEFGSYAIWHVSAEPRIKDISFNETFPYGSLTISSIHSGIGFSYDLRHESDLYSKSRMVVRFSYDLRQDASRILSNMMS